MTANGRKKTMEGMTTARPSPKVRPVSAPFHTSTRTAFSMNVDPETGRSTQHMRTARLEMRWIAGELRVEYQAAQARSEEGAPRWQKGSAGRGRL